MDGVSLWDRVRSARYRWLIACSEWSGRLRSPRPDEPLAALSAWPAAAHERAVLLSQRYGGGFEAFLDEPSALQAYEYLDMLDQALGALPVTVRPGGVLHDVGCASFSYAAALYAVFRPGRLIGVEREGFRRLADGRNRAERAAALLGRLPSASFEIADYASFSAPADTITAFFPFVTPAPVLGWRMPLSVLQPAALFSRIHDNLAADGLVIMVNHSTEEARVAFRYAGAAGLRLLGQHEPTPLFVAREKPAVLSAWARPEASVSAAT